MKIFYIKQNTSVIRNLIDESILSAFKESGAEIVEFDFACFYFLHREILEKYRNDQNQRFPEAAIQQLSTEIVSNMIPSLVLDAQPDLVFMINGDLLHPPAVKLIKKMGYKIICWQIDDPYTIDKTVELSPHLDSLFSVDRSTLEIYQKAGCKKTHFLPLGFIGEKYRKDQVATAEHQSDLCFIGTPFAGSYRVKIIDELIPFFKENNIRFKIIGSHVLGETWQTSLRHYALAKDSIREDFISPEEAAKYYRGAKIVLNIHRDSFFSAIDSNKNNVVARSINERTFNIGACGAFQIIDDRREVQDFYEENQEIAIFRNLDELKEKIKYFLSHDQAREAIAHKSYLKTSTNYSLLNQVRKILSLSQI